MISALRRGEGVVQKNVDGSDKSRAWDCDKGAREGSINPRICGHHIQGYSTQVDITRRLLDQV